MPASENASFGPESGESYSWTKEVSTLATEKAKLVTAGTFTATRTPVQDAIAYCDLNRAKAISHLTDSGAGTSTTVWEYDSKTGQPSRGPTMSFVKWEHEKANYEDITEFGQKDPEKTTSSSNAKA